MFEIDPEGASTGDRITSSFRLLAFAIIFSNTRPSGPPHLIEAVFAYLMSGASLASDLHRIYCKHKKCLCVVEKNFTEKNRTRVPG